MSQWSDNVAVVQKGLQNSRERERARAAAARVQAVSCVLLYRRVLSTSNM